MQIDETTLSDLGIVAPHEENSIVHMLDFTLTSGGRAWLRHFLKNPLEHVEQMIAIQNTIKRFMESVNTFPETITNGTMMVLDRYYENPVASIPQHSGSVGNFFYTLFNKSDYVVARYSVKHIISFVKGMHTLTEMLWHADNPLPLQILLNRANDILKKPLFQKVMSFDLNEKLPAKKVIDVGAQFYKVKSDIRVLETIFYKFDAWFSMAKACKAYKYCFPEIVDVNEPFINADNLWHPLIKDPIGYSFSMSQQKNFMFLTGANMAGKSTFIRAVGISVYLSACGMGVPAGSFRLSKFDGLLSNIDIADNTLKGESYFYNEVQRINKTVDKITDGKNWLILIDELFKGTNIQDAMKCSIAVIEGFRKIKTAIFVLSTHLYEIGQDLKHYENIQFKYFETSVKNNDRLSFSYQLKDGISNDRLGFLILQREGVVQKLAML